MEKTKEKKPNKIKIWYDGFKQKHGRLAEIVRFVIVGGIATVIDYFVMGVILYIFDPSLYPNFFNVFYGGGEPKTIATVVGTGTGFVVSLIFNYLLSVLFVYEEKGNSKTAKGVILFVVLSTIGMLLNMGGMWLGYDILGINEWIVKIFMTIVVLVYNYVTRKLFIFKKSQNTPKSDSQNPSENQESDSQSVSALKE